MAAQWTDLEILTTYRQAADKNKQIGILAELTGKSKLQIIEILRAGGEKVDGRVLGGVKGGKARAKKEAEAKPKPVPEPTATVANAAKAYEWLTIDGEMLRYLRHLAEMHTEGTGSVEEDLRITEQIADIVVFLLEGK